MLKAHAVWFAGGVVDPFGRKGGASLETTGNTPAFQPMFLIYVGFLAFICAAAAFLCTKSSAWQKWQNRAVGKSPRVMRR
jgi:hypothetical protein